MRCRYSTWIGGSLLSSSPHFAEYWLTKEDYDVYGPKLVHRKCL